MKKFLSLVALPLILPALVLFVWPVGAIHAESQATEALDEVNAIRKANGLAPYVRDDGLTQAAARCAAARAAGLCFGHTSNDFAYLPSGVAADAAGCAAYEPSHGWLSCAIFDDYRFGGAAFVTGRDGKRYMHLFVRGGSGRTLGQTVPVNGPAPTATPAVSCPGGACPVAAGKRVGCGPTVAVGPRPIGQMRFPRLRLHLGRLRCGR